MLANEKVAFSDSDGAPLTPQRVVDHLVRCGLLERVEELGANRVRFVDEPIAELLYAKSLLDQGGSKLQELRRRLAREGEDVRGLREALEAGWNIDIWVDDGRDTEHCIEYVRKVLSKAGAAPTTRISIVRTEERSLG